MSGGVTSACLVLAACDITHVMKFVLYSPMRARQRKQFSGTSLLGGVTGDCVHRLDGFLAAHDPFACDAADLPHPLPVRCQVFADRGCGFDLPGFDPAVTLLDGLGTPEIRRC
jgi:hypothetical protein